MSTRISIVIPLYNNAKYIGECIDSVIAQTLTPHEIIVVDDGSADRGGYLAASYQQVTLISQENQGVTAARRTGVSRATGDWIFFLDSDDTLLPTALEHLAAKAGTDVDAVISRTAYERTLTGEEYIEAIFKRDASREIWGNLYRRTLFDDGFALAMPREIRLGEDLLMNMRIGSRTKGKIETTTDCDYNYRRHDTQTVRTVHITSHDEINFDRELRASFGPEAYAKFLPLIIHLRIGEYRDILSSQNRTQDFDIKHTEWFKTLREDIRRTDCRLTAYEWAIMHLANRHNIAFLGFAFDLPRILRWKVKCLFSH